MKKEVCISKENVSVCEMCGKSRDLRMGWCWDCATAQNIIHIGQDMHGDDDPNAFKMPVKEVNERLKMLIEKGWKTGIK